MNILYLGDIMGRPGREIVGKFLPGLRRKYEADVVIAQAENVSHGKAMTPQHMHELMHIGVDAFSGGNHSIERPSTIALLENPNTPVTAPINQPGVKPEWGVKVLSTPKGDVQIISLLGTVFPNLQEPIGNPLRKIDEVLEQTKKQKFAARILNFHGDFSSEKRVIGYYLDGRVSAVIGDHWHIPTADAMVLPGGTAHITDVGMCGTLLTSLGVSKELIIERWRDGVKNKNDIAHGGPYQLNAVLVQVKKDGLAKKIEQINLIVDEL
jgi:metallophosphoesterase (TIGR00282 family)